MKIAGIEYSFLMASDIQRDGLGLECYRVSGESKEMVLEVFRSDAEQKYLVSQFVPELPLELFEHVIAIARQELGGFVV